MVFGLGAVGLMAVMAAAQVPAYLEMWRRGVLDLLHSDTRPLADINESLDALAEGRVVRRIFTLR
jgi:alcohol dehydrogenase